MSVFYEKVCRVDSRDVDLFGCCRPSALLGILQEVATLAACELHVSRDEMLARYNIFWMLVRGWYRLERPLRWDERVTVRTWHRGGKGAAMYRDFDLFSGGEQVGEAVSTWTLADQDTHKIFRLADVSELAGTDGGELCKDRLLHRPKLPKDLPLAEERPMRYSDCDINGHVNNTRYADFACDALGLERLGLNRFVETFQVGYLRECLPGERLSIYTGGEGEQRCVHGVGGDGVPRFDVALTLASTAGGGENRA